MTLYKIQLIGITLLLFISGCTKKDELARPVKIQLKVCMLTRYASGLSNPPYFYFQRGQIGIKRIRFEGKRQEGGDFVFETDPRKNWNILEFSSDTTFISEFDIPKGIYNYMKWDITLKKIGWTKGFIDDSKDSLNIGAVFSGFYKYRDPIDIPLLFAIDDTVQFSFRFHENGGNSINISSENNPEAVLLFDPEYVFSQISRQSIREAEIAIDGGGDPVIIISSYKNRELYDFLLHRIYQSGNILVK